MAFTTFNFGQINTQNSVNAAGYIKGTIVQQVQFVDTASSTSSGGTFIATTTTASITPHASTHKIKISVSGTLTNTQFTAANTYMTIFRGASDLGNGSGFQEISGGTTNVAPDMPCAVVYLDSPATTSSTTYTVAIKQVGAGNANWNRNTGTAVILLEEIAA